MDKNSKIYIAGHKGMVGSAILKNLQSKGYANFVFTPYPAYDLTDQTTVSNFFEKEKPQYVIDAAAKVGGILANDTYRAQFLYENMMIQNNLIHNAHLHGVKKFLFLGSSCIYPRDCQQPIKEEYILSGLLEQTNEPYAIAKISGIKMCENYFRQYGSNFISIMPTNLYGPGDNYHSENSHVIPGLIKKFHEAIVKGKSFVEVWGSGKPKREFLYVDDMADAAIFLLENLNAISLYPLGVTHLNVGCGIDVSISELATTISKVVGYNGNIKFNSSMPDGTPKKLLNVSRLNDMGWYHKTSLETGLKLAYDDFKLLKLA